MGPSSCCLDDATEQVRPPHMQKAIHCLCGGTGIAPMVQVLDALVRRYNSEPSSMLRPIARLWSVNRRCDDVVLPAAMVSVQQRGTLAGLHVHITNVLTRGPKDAPSPCDPCVALGGTSSLLLGRPELSKLVEAVPTEEIASALLLICGPEAFNEAMLSAAKVSGYAEKNIFVRDTPKDV